MHKALNIRIVSQTEFARLPGVNPQHTILNAPYEFPGNAVNGYNAEASIIRSGSDINKPSYTTRAITCTAGFLRVRLGTQVHSHIMFHLMGAKIGAKDPIGAVRKNFGAKLEEFFNGLDASIRLNPQADLNIEYVLTGTINRSQGLDQDAGYQVTQLYSQAVKDTCKSVLQQEIEKLKKQHPPTKVRSSEFTGQCLVSLDEKNMQRFLPLSHIYYDGDNTIYLAAGHQNREIETSIAEHYTTIDIAPEHNYPEGQEAMQLSQWRRALGASKDFYNMNNLSNVGQISTGIGNNGFYITVHYRDRSIAYKICNGELTNITGTNEAAPRIDISQHTGPSSDYYFHAAQFYRNNQEAKSSNPEIIQAALNDPQKRVAIYTGAGISISAGIKGSEAYLKSLIGDNATRSITNTDMETLIRRLESNPKSVLQAIEDFNRSLYFTPPSPAHIAIAKLSHRPETIVFTENLDSLHQRSGISPIVMKPAQEMLSELDIEELKKIDVLITTGLSHDDRGFIAYLRELNPQLQIIANAHPGEVPDFINPNNALDIFVPGDAQEIFPEL